MDCAQIFGGKRKKRDVDRDEIDQIFCGTTIKVIDPSKKIGKYQGNIRDMVFIHPQLKQWTDKNETNKNYHTIGTVPQFHRQIVDLEIKKSNTPLFGTGTSIKSGGVKTVLWERYKFTRVGITYSIFRQTTIVSFFLGSKYLLNAAKANAKK